jgi:hypothetical protein
MIVLPNGFNFDYKAVNINSVIPHFKEFPLL